MLRMRIGTRNGAAAMQNMHGLVARSGSMVLSGALLMLVAPTGGKGQPSSGRRAPSYRCDDVVVIGAVSSDLLTEAAATIPPLTVLLMAFNVAVSIMV
jgi:hypothetical protein